MAASPEIQNAYLYDLLSRTTAGYTQSGTTTDSAVDTFGVIDTSKHGKMAVTVVNTDVANSIDYSVEICGNPLDAVPVWAVYDSGTVVNGGLKVVVASTLSPATRLTLKSSSAGNPATFQAYFRLNPM